MPASDLMDRLIPLALAAIGLIVAGAIVVFVVRRNLRGAARTQDPFTLGDLRTLRESGQITEHEYESMRAAILGKIRDEPDRSKQ